MADTTTLNGSPLLQVDDLSVAFGRGDERETVVRGVTFSIQAGEKVALVGESGSGKTVTALSVLRLHDPGLSHYPSGRILFEGRDLLRLDDDGIRAVRGREIGVIFQEPMTALNPVYTVGEQLIEPLTLHLAMDRAQARQRVIELLDRTGIKEPQKRIDAYPHMLSGGQRQRAMIAMALACRPKLLIADEPTTALDVTIQAQILELLEDLQREFGMAIMMITHDLNMVRRFADRILVMQRGEMVEQAATGELFERPRHPYTKQLLASRPERLVGAVSGTAPVLMEAKEIRCYFPIRAGFFRKQIGEVKAVDDVSLRLHRGETLGIVGESGSGKTTLGLSLLRLQDCSGEIVFDGKSLQQLRGRELRPQRRHFQVVFQDPFSSLSPRMTVDRIIEEGLRLHMPELDSAQRRERVLAVLDEVGLDASILWRYPHEFSGGQRQRIAIARVLVLEPKLLLLDEPTSALDVSVQKQVLKLLVALQQRHGISYLFITHDLGVIRAMAHRLLVMKNGQAVEEGETEAIFANPRQDYTRTLLHASLFAQGLDQ